MESIKPKTYSSTYSFVLSTLFLVLIFSMNFLVNEMSLVDRITEIRFSEALLLTLACFRLIRLFVYDSVSQFIRDMFLEVSEVKKGKEIFIKRNKPKNGIKRLICDLIGCPWCSSVWISLFACFVYFMFPELWFIYFVFAISGVSTAIQIAMNLVGWSAEKKKLETLKLDN